MPKKLRWLIFFNSTIYTLYTIRYPLLVYCTFYTIYTSMTVFMDDVIFILLLKNRAYSGGTFVCVCVYSYIHHYYIIEKLQHRTRREK